MSRNKARACKSEKAVYEASLILRHACNLSPELCRLIVARLAGRRTWEALASSEMGDKRSVKAVKKRYRDGVHSLSKWIEWADPSEPRTPTKQTKPEDSFL